MSNSPPQFSFINSIDRSFVQRESYIPNHGESEAGLWQMTPSPEVDAAWEKLMRGYKILITEEDMHRLGKNPANYIKVPEEYGYGEKKYLAQFAHPHNVHCLDHIRKPLYADHYNYTNITVDWLHTNHCFHALLDHLTCYVHYDVYNYVWVDGEPWPQPELKYNRQCRKLDALIDWNRENRVDLDKRVFYLQPDEDSKIFPPDPEWRKLEKGMERSNPQVPNMEETRLANVRAHHDAMVQWRETGIIPIDEEARKMWP